MMSAMQAVTTVVLKATGGTFAGAGLLNLLENQVTTILNDS
jgi:hypothetical protein